MDLNLILEKTRHISKEILEEDASIIEKEERWPERGIRALQAAGLGGLVVPIDYGGLGQGLVGMVRVCEILGNHCASTALCLGMHFSATATISVKATPYHIENFLKPICEGTHLTTLALSETGTGAHFYFPETELFDETENHFRINGQKSFITNGNFADSFVFSTTAVNSTNLEGLFSLLLATNGSQGLSWGKEWKGLGMKGNNSRTLNIENLQIEKKNLLGNKGDHVWYAFHIIAPFFLTAMTGTYLGIANRAYEEARSHILKRTHNHSRKSLSEDPMVQYKLSQIWVKIERTRQYVYWACKEFDEGGPDALHAILSTKAEVGDCVIEVVNEALTLCGGSAYNEHSVLKRLLLDARACHVMAPTTDMLRLWAGRSLLDQPLLGD